MVNTNNILVERNKELLAKIEELENKEKTEISREAQLKIIDKIEQWKKENYEVGDRLKKYESNTYPAHIMDNLKEDRPIWKSLAGHVNFELLMVQYLHKKENPLDELIEMMLNSITRNVVRHYSENGLREKELVENRGLKGKLREIKQEKETYYKELIEKELEINELREELKERELIIEHWKQRAERGEEDAEIHFKALTEVSKRWNEEKLEWWVGVFYKKLLDLNTVRNWQIENLENFVAWQEYVADKQFKELPSLPKKENKFKILTSKVKSKANEVKVAVKEKFNAYILQKNK